MLNYNNYGYYPIYWHHVSGHFPMKIFWTYVDPASAVSGLQGSAQPPAKKTAGQIEKETLKKRMSNIES